MPRAPGCGPIRASRGRPVPDEASRPAWLARAGLVLACVAATLVLATPAHRLAPQAFAASRAAVEPADAVPIAGAFVYPVGDELDYTHPRAGDAGGYHISDPYLARRGSGEARVHRGVDLSNGTGGATVRSIGSGVVVVADGNALVKTRRKVKTKTTKVVKGKKVTKTGWKWKTSWKWRTGWGNYVVVKHTLPSGESVYSLYAHLAPKSVCVDAGTVVAAGEPLGRIGRSGRASSPHLHLEIRKNVPDPELGGRSDNEPEAEPTAQDRTFALLQTVDPVAFLEKHVRRFEDLKPDSWEARYALAACRDGLAAPEKDRFDPGGTLERAEFYRSLVLTFRLSTAFPAGDWSSTLALLVGAGVLDNEGSRGQKPDDKLTQSDALEVLLRCLERHRARGHNLAGLDPMQLCLDFNRRFAGADAADAAARKARLAAAKETEARRKAEADRVARAKKAAKAAGKKSRVKARPVHPVAPAPILDPGFEALAQSKKSLTRAEGCLLLASALRARPERMSALERAAVRVAQSE